MSDAPDDLLARLRVLPAVAALAGEPGVHAVGGAVRDLLLGGEPHEVDLVVEDDAVALARRLGLELVAVHERFGTVTVRIGGAVADLTSARRERYGRPGALPEVELGVSLAADLERRDFTVNAIAVALEDGRVAAVPEAFEDLAAGRLRVLHPRSFSDDPTRLVRGARYAARLGFEYDGATAKLARAAIEAGAPATVSGSRLGAELGLLLREPQPEAIQRLAWGGLGEAVLGAELRPDPESLRRALALCPPEARADLVALAASWPARGEEVTRRSRELGFTAGELVVLGAAASLPFVLDSLEDAGGEGPPPRSKADGVLRRKPLELAVLAAAAGRPGAAAARRWLEVDRHRRLAISGDDLVEGGLSGPAVGTGLAAARAAMLDGTAPDRDAQLAAALAA